MLSECMLSECMLSECMFGSQSVCYPVHVLLGNAVFNSIRILQIETVFYIHK